MSNAKGGRKELSEKAREGRRKGALIRNSGKYPLAAVSPANILARYEAGEEIPAIAHQLGVSPQAVYRHVVGKAPEQWREYQSARAEHDLQQALDGLRGVTDPLEVACARERLSIAKWRLEKLNRRLYGQDAPLQTGSGVTISIDLSSLQQAIDSKVNDQED